MKIAGVVTIYNPECDINKNIETYIDYIDVLYVIDNSDNNRMSKVLIKNSKIKYIYQGQNVGIGKALNIGCDNAIKKGFEWILTMDQDSYFIDNSIEILINDINNLKNKNIGIISPWLNTKLNYKKSLQKYDYPTDVMTSGNLLNLDAYKKVGKFREDFFIDGIDIEYCLRLKSNGYMIIRNNSAELNHGYGDCKIIKRFGRTYNCTNHNYLRRYYIVRNYNYINDLYKEKFPELCKELVNQRHYITNIIIGEKDKYRKIRNSIRGYIDYKKNKIGQYNYKN